MLSIFQATMLAEGVDEPESEEQLIEAWQLLIDTGTCWQLQGFFGRTARSLIDNGVCQPANYTGVHHEQLHITTSTG